MNKARLAEAGRGIIQKKICLLRKTYRRFVSLDRGHNEISHSSLNDAWHSGKTEGMDGTKECINKKPREIGAFCCN